MEKCFTSFLKRYGSWCKKKKRKKDSYNAMKRNMYTRIKELTVLPAILNYQRTKTRFLLINKDIIFRMPKFVNVDRLSTRFFEISIHRIDGIKHT